MQKIVHISDLHFGALHKTAFLALEEYLDQNTHDLTVISGDLTQRGRKIEFEQAGTFLKKIGNPFLVIPGNHDVPVLNIWRRFLTPWSRYKKHIHTVLDPEICVDTLFVAGLNSARRAGPYLDWSRGRLSKTQIDQLQSKLNKTASSMKAVALHHPLYIGKGKAGSRTVERADLALAVIAEENADLVFTGHVHHTQSAIATHQGWSFVQSKAGTTTSFRTRGEPNSFNAIYIDGNDMQIEEMILSDGKFIKHQSSFYSRYPDGWRMSHSSE